MQYPRIVDVETVARKLDVAPTTIRDPRYRRRIGLPLVKVGGRVLGVYESDLIALLRSGRENLGRSGDDGHRGRVA